LVRPINFPIGATEQPKAIGTWVGKEGIIPGWEFGIPGVGKAQGNRFFPLIFVGTQGFLPIGFGFLNSPFGRGLGFPRGLI